MDNYIIFITLTCRNVTKNENFDFTSDTKILEEISRISLECI